MKPRRLHLAIAAVATAGLTILGGTAASAFWTSSAATNAAAQTDALPQGATPTTSLSGATVTVTFAAATTTQGHVAATGYVVRRYTAASGGTGTTLSCTASPCTDTPGAGTWYYTDTPLLGANWQGAESARSAGQAVAYGPAAKLAFTQQPSSPTAPNTAFATQPAVTVQDSAGNTVSSATTAVTLALTSPGGATLACSANPTNAASGVATFAGCKVDKAGTYTLTATASGLTGATSNSFTIASQAAVTSLSMANGSGATLGTADAKDTLTITFATAMNPKTFCSGWAGTGPWSFTVTAAGVSIQILDNGTNDTLAVSGPTGTCPTFNLGTVALGGDYVSSTATFNGTGNGQVMLSADGKTLTITLGKLSSGNVKSNVTAGTPNYTPASGLADTQGNALPTTTFTGTQSGF